MTNTDAAPDTAPEVFRHAVAALRSLRVRDEITVEETRPPTRLAPWAFAVTAEASGPTEEVATARLVLLHDPEGQQGWDGVLRLVVFLRADLDPEVARDPFLPTVGWSWLTEALDEHAGSGHYRALAGTVTVTSSARFGELADSTATHDLELRASWTPSSEDMAQHGHAFTELIASATGLPPEGVASLGHFAQGSHRD